MPQTTSAQTPGRRRGRPPRTDTAAAPAKSASILQTLDRGLETLALIAARPSGLPIAELAGLIGVHRAIAYRLVATLEAHNLVARGQDGHIRTGPGVIGLAAGFEPQLRMAAQPILHRLAEEACATAFLAVSHGDDCVSVCVAEPHGSGIMRVSFRVGSRHPLGIGAAGIAILAGRPCRDDDPPTVAAARRDGFCVTRGAIKVGTVGVACPLHGTSGFLAGAEASIGVIGLEDLDVVLASHAVRTRTEELKSILSFGIGASS